MSAPFTRHLAGLLSISIGVASFPSTALAGPGVAVAPKSVSFGNVSPVGRAALLTPGVGLTSLSPINLSLSLQGNLPDLAPLLIEGETVLQPGLKEAVAQAPVAQSVLQRPRSVAAPQTVSPAPKKKSQIIPEKLLPNQGKTSIGALQTTVANIERGAMPSLSLDEMYLARQRGNAADAAAAVAVPWGTGRPGLTLFSDAARAALEFVSVPTPDGSAAKPKPPKKPKWSGKKKLLVIGGAVLALAAAAPVFVPGLTAVGAWGIASDVGYYVANVGAFLYPLPQIYKLFKFRSGRVSTLGLGIGIASSVLLAFNAAFAVKSFWVAQNLFGVLGLGASYALVKWFKKHPSTVKPGKGFDKSALLKTLGVIGAIVPLTLGIGWALMQGVPMIAAASSIIVPFQIVASLGFAYLLFPQLRKIELEKDVGDTSPAMAWLYLVANAGLLVWSLYEAALLGGSMFGGLLGAAAFTGIITVIARWQLPKLARKSWKKLPDSLKKLAGFLSVGTLMAITTGLGLLAMSALGGWPSVGVNEYLMYMLYASSNVFGGLISIQTLQAIAHNKRKTNP